MPGHLAVGVKASKEYAQSQNPGKRTTYYNHNGSRYYVAEMNDNTRIGEKPSWWTKYDGKVDVVALS